MAPCSDGAGDSWKRIEPLCRFSHSPIGRFSEATVEMAIRARLRVSFDLKAAGILRLWSLQSMAPKNSSADGLLSEYPGGELQGRLPLCAQAMASSLKLSWGRGFPRVIPRSHCRTNAQGTAQNLFALPA